MARGRHLHSATLLPDGQVLVAGGLVLDTGYYVPVGTAERFDPATNSWRSQSQLISPTDRPVAVLLPSEQVLLVGGYKNRAYALALPQWYVPVSNQWIGIP